MHTSLLPAVIVSLAHSHVDAIRVGDSWGTNIHWTQETTPGEAAMLAKAYKVARMDFHWGTIEGKCGKFVVARSEKLDILTHQPFINITGSYDFSQYDKLLGNMTNVGVRPYWILDYGNPCYPPAPMPKVDCSSESTCKATCQQYFNKCSDGVYYCCQKPGGNPSGCNLQHRCPSNPTLNACACNHPNGSIADTGLIVHESKVSASDLLSLNSPCNTAECISAFGKFAAAAVEHFKGHNIVWECLNEPNGMGEDNGTDIAALCLAAGKEILSAGETFVGPATSGFAWPYLNKSMGSGILKAFSAVSVHPYRPGSPETVLDDWVMLRSMIQSFGTTTKQKEMPMISGEWGYTSAMPPCVYSNRVDELQQGAYLTRMWLTNTMAGIPISINYDWRDDGANATQCESNFGSVHGTPTGIPEAPFVPKPAYRAALTLQTALGDYEAVKERLPVKVVSPSTIPAANVFALPFSRSTGIDAFAVWSNGTIAKLMPCGGDIPDRRDCGHFGIDKTDCLSPSNPKGPDCCWEPDPNKVGGPQCYKEVQYLLPSITVQFDGGSASANKCWKEIDIFGNTIQTSVCGDADGMITVTIPKVSPNATTTTPVYLIYGKAQEEYGNLKQN